MRDLETIEADDVESRYGWCSCHVSPGDGYIVALLAGLIAAAAGLGLVLRKAGFVPPMAVLLALAAIVVAATNVFAESWTALAFTRSAFLQEVKGSPTVWLWAELVVAGLAGILGAALWGIVRNEHEEMQDDESEWVNTA
jgi:hypothetical protein